MLPCNISAAGGNVSDFIVERFSTSTSSISRISRRRYRQERKQQRRGETAGPVGTATTTFTFFWCSSDCGERRRAHGQAMKSSETAELNGSEAGDRGQRQALMGWLARLSAA